MPGGARAERAIRRWLPALGWMMLIFWFSSRSDLPSASIPVLELLLKKGAHVGAYAVLAILLARAIALPRYGRRVAFALAVLYAISDEFHQSFTPGRMPQATDVLIDAAGAWWGLYALRGIVTGGRARNLGDRRDRADDAPHA